MLTIPICTIIRRLTAAAIGKSTGHRQLAIPSTSMRVGSSSKVGVAIHRSEPTLGRSCVTRPITKPASLTIVNGESRLASCHLSHTYPA